MGQGLVFMVLVTDIATFPVDFRFFTPDPALTQWRKQDKRLREKGVTKKDRPKSPEPDHCRYPTKQALAINMVRTFVKNSFPLGRLGRPEEVADLVVFLSSSFSFLS